MEKKSDTEDAESEARKVTMVRMSKEIDERDKKLRKERATKDALGRILENECQIAAILESSLLS